MYMSSKERHEKKRNDCVKSLNFYLSFLYFVISTRMGINVLMDAFTTESEKLKNAVEVSIHSMFMFKNNWIVLVCGENQMKLFYFIES